MKRSGRVFGMIGRLIGNSRCLFGIYGFLIGNFLYFIGIRRVLFGFTLLFPAKIISGQRFLT